MNDQSLTAGLVMQRQSAREHIDDIWKRMSMPWQRGMGCDGQLDGCKLRLARGIVRVRLAIPRLSCLQQNLAVTARDGISTVLSEYCRYVE